MAIEPISLFNIYPSYNGNVENDFSNIQRSRKSELLGMKSCIIEVTDILLELANIRKFMYIFLYSIAFNKCKRGHA